MKADLGRGFTCSTGVTTSSYTIDGRLLRDGRLGGNFGLMTFLGLAAFGLAAFGLAAFGLAATFGLAAFGLETTFGLEATFELKVGS